MPRRLPAPLRSPVRYLINRLGYDLLPRTRDKHGESLARDLVALPGDMDVIIDVGSNEGQMAHYLLAAFPNATMHCFEPNRETFLKLTARLGNRPNTYLHQVALGDEAGMADFHVGPDTQTNSLLPDSTAARQSPSMNWARNDQTVQVEVTTFDRFCEAAQLDHVSLLKIDTQGYDLKVLQGAQQSLAKGIIHAVFVEMLFATLYDNQAKPHEIFAFFQAYGYEFMGLYALDRDERAVIMWCDALFVKPPAR